MGDKKINAPPVKSIPLVSFGLKLEWRKTGPVSPAILPAWGGRDFFKIIDMELELIRTYYWSGTNGKILFQGRLIVYTIKLPWQDNHTRKYLIWNVAKSFEIK